MGVIRSFLGFVVVVLLTTSLVAGNAVTAVDRTAMNEEFITTTLEEERAYTTVQSIAGEQAATQVESADLPVEIDARRAVNETLTRAYLKNQTEANVNRTFRFLQEDTDSLNASVNLLPVKENIAALVETRIRELTVGELIDIITDSQDLSTEIGNVSVDLRVVSDMSEGPDAYNESREEFRADIREQVVNRTYRDRSNDELLSLIGEDPNQYNESEKERIVNEREGEIKTAIRNESGDTIDEGVNEVLASLNDQVTTSVAPVVNDSLSSRYAPVADPATNMLVAGVEGLTARNKSYAEFDAELSQSKSNLAENVSVVALAELDSRVDDRYHLIQNSEQLSDSERDRLRNNLQQAQTRYSRAKLVASLVWFVPLALIGLLFLITRSLSTTALLSGLPMAVVGGGTYAVATAAPGLIESRVRSELSAGELPEGTLELMMGIVEQVLGVVASQSLLLGLLGAGLLVGGVVLRTAD